MSMGVGAVLVDFDGTASLHDVAEHLLQAFATPGWEALDTAVDRNEIGLRDSILAQDSMFDADRETLLAYALDHCTMDPTFRPFLSWLAANDVPAAIVSDGFGFYVDPLLASAGIEGLTVITNDQVWTAQGRPNGMRFANGHAECVGCGTCKMQAVLSYRARHGSVAFVGDGQTDRYAALYADITFAKRDLIAHCERDGVPFVPWDDFDDVREALETIASPGPVAPVRCPGWTLPPP